jgi:hypothetical protein
MRGSTAGSPRGSPKNFLSGGQRESVAESGVRPEPTPPAYRKEPRMKPEPVRVVLEVSEADTVKELMGRLEQRVMREVLCWCLRYDIRPTERVGDLITFTFKSFSRRSYPERLTNWCIHLMTSSGTATLQ